MPRGATPSRAPRGLHSAPGAAGVILGHHGTNTNVIVGDITRLCSASAVRIYLVLYMLRSVFE